MIWPNTFWSMIEIERPFGESDIVTWDGVLAPGYGRIADTIRDAISLMYRTEGILLDPVYSAKTFAGLLGLLKEERIIPGQKVLMLHTGGLAAVFGYQDSLL